MLSPGSAEGADADRLYAIHAEWLLRWLSRHTRCGFKAADLMQDTFCRLLERPTARPIANPRGYLATIARRLLIDDTRRARVEAAFLETQAAMTAGLATPGADRILEAIEELCIVARALDALSAKARRAYLLARLDGWNHGDIAAELGVSKSMVKQYVARGYAQCYAAIYG